MGKIKCAAICQGGQPCILDGALRHTLHMCARSGCKCHNSTRRAVPSAIEQAIARITSRYGDDPDMRIVLVYLGVIEELP